MSIQLLMGELHESRSPCNSGHEYALRDGRVWGEVLERR